MTTGISGALTSSQLAEASDKTKNAETKLAGDFDTFMTLLTTQMQNQDPLSPMDTHQFTSQLVQYSEVEQAIATNSRLETLISLQTGQSIAEQASFIGKVVETDGSEAKLAEDKSAVWAYTVPEGADELELQVTDNLGNVVYTTTGNENAGIHSFSWGGEDRAGGQAQPGTYLLKVKARDGDGDPVDAIAGVAGPVDSVDLDGADVRLNVGGYTIAANEVRRIIDPAALE